MANLTYREKLVLEELFGMETGYVMDFSNSSFARFVGDVVDIDIYGGPGYEEYCSKANKLRQIWEQEPDYVVGKLVEALLSYFEDLQLKRNSLSDYERKKISEMQIVASRLKENTPQVQLPSKQEESLQTLLEDINNSLKRNKPELVLDRLHTFSTKFLRQICTENGIDVTDNKGEKLPLHSLVGMLLKQYKQDELFQSSFTLTAIKYSISLFEKYNSVRNNQSYAHDNEVLSTMEAEFAVRIMADLLTFIDTTENYRNRVNKEQNQQFFCDDEIPF